jgi:Mg2+-importing ATPase
MPFANDIGLSPLPFINLGAMLAIVALYILTADLLKVWFFRKYRSA